ncbi:MAG TPA: S49 family peptidase, partial [Bdellovibrionota bacterium]|nr:S49 family peptidase [Bdellovibrionota bacterium]
MGFLQSLVWLAKLLGALSLLLLVLTGLLAGVAWWIGSRRRVRIPRGTVVEWSLASAPREASSPWPGGRSLNLRDTLQALEAAAHDPRVEALWADLSTVHLGMAQAQELHAAVLKFRASGKATVAFADTFGEGGSTAALLLASAFARVGMQPSGSVAAGFATQQPFVAGFLKRLGIEVQMGRRHEYKGAAETLLQERMGDANREATTALVKDWTRQWCEAVAQARGLAPADVMAGLDAVPLSAQAALDRKWIDVLEYRDGSRECWEGEVDGKRRKNKFVSIERYSRRAARRSRAGRRATQLAWISASGQVVRGTERGGTRRRDRMSAHRVGAALRAAIDNRRVKGILLRVDSPGGSYVASDTIAREVIRARAKKKPVVVCMGNLAASGGYFVSMFADRIVAQPGTLTGSIGVFGGKLVAKEALARVGLNFDGVAGSRGATHSSALVPYDEHGRAALERELDFIYDDFVTRA